MSQITLNFLKTKEKHHFHLVDNSQLPLTTSTSAMLLVMSFVFYFHPTTPFFLHDIDNTVFHSSWFGFSIALFAWFIIVLIESGQGHHTWVVRNGLRFGMVLFIVSEVMFFFAFFWAFFHVSLAPAISIGGIWPPKSIQSLDVWGLPLMNTILLLSSGVTITFAHREILKTMNSISFDSFSKHLGVTIILGTVFLFCQWIEYKYGIIFRWKENVYGTTFFVTTGFHGLHVSIGTIFLLFCLVRNLITSPYSFLSFETKKTLNYLMTIPYSYFVVKSKKSIYRDLWNSFLKLFGTKSVTENVAIVKEVNSGQNWLGKFSFRKNQHLGFEAAAWYWHFVDVVWIFLFITVYWWGS